MRGVFKLENTKKMQFPVVCTRDVIVFPYEEVAIEVGRPISLNAVRRSSDNFNDEIFLVSQKNAMVDDPNPEDLYQIGTLCKIISNHKKDGFSKIVFKGIARAKAKDWKAVGSSLFADIEILSDIVGKADEELVLVRKVSKELETFEALHALIRPEVIADFANGVSAPRLADHVAQIFPFTIDKRQTFLEMLNVNERLLNIIKALEQEKQFAAIENDINIKVRTRVEESQKEYYLRERLRAIKEELGDVPEQSEDADSIREQLEKNPYPKYIKDKVTEELARYEMLPSSSGESGVIKSYIDWLMKLPWWQVSLDNQDLSIAEARLEEDHFGLK